MAKRVITELSLPSEIFGPVGNIKGIGQARGRLLKNLGINSINDALWFFPRKYIDRRNFLTISGLQPGEAAVVRGTISKINFKKSLRTGIYFAVCDICDGTGTASAVWFNSRRLNCILSEGTALVIFGVPSFNDGKAEFLNPAFEVTNGNNDISSFMGIVPVYPSTSGMSERWFRKFMTGIIEDYLPLVDEYLPLKILEKRSLLPIQEALRGMHRPESEENWKNSRKRLAYEEFLLLQSVLMLRKNKLKRTAPSVKIVPGGPCYSKFMSLLPFELSAAQKKVFSEVFKDTRRGQPMSRLLQGDVGSGKTIIALGLAAACADAGIQAAILVPTEVLAEQIYSQAQRFLVPAGIICSLIKGGQSRAERMSVTESVRSGQSCVAIGTHAMLQDGIDFHHLGTVIIDEQQRFGVMQRGEILSRGKAPHLLMMSATPIPRTIAVCLFGDLDISVLTERPEGRKHTETRLIDFTRIQDLMQFIINESAAGGRTYWICPRVEDEEGDEIASVKKRYCFLNKHLGPLGIGLIHGKMTADSKNSEIEKFREGTTRVLVGTTVLEVGVDVPEASVVVIESPEFYGLSQLHQLRGRVGRGGRRGVCVLLAKKLEENLDERLDVILKTDDGFKIAEADYNLRGPGKITGCKQHGTADFKIADIYMDTKLLRYSREDAAELISNDPDLSESPLFARKLDAYTDEVSARSLKA